MGSIILLLEIPTMTTPVPKANRVAMVLVVQKRAFVIMVQKPVAQTASHLMINAGQTAMPMQHVASIPSLATRNAL
jgi:hypothetical protein